MQSNIEDKEDIKTQILITDNKSIVDKERKKIISDFYSNSTSSDNNKIKMTIEEINFINNIKSYNFMDFIFPFHTIFQTNEKIYDHLNENFSSNYNYYYYKRYIFLNALASNFEFNKYKTIETTNKLVDLEKKYFYINSFFLASGFLFTIYSLTKRNFINLYLGTSLIVNSKVYSMISINNELNGILANMKYKGKSFQQEEMILERDLLDETLIKDNKCHLYYYGIY